MNSSCSPDWRRALDARVVRLRLGVADSARLDRPGLKERLRHNLHKGSDLWLLYEEGFNTDREQTPEPCPFPMLTFFACSRLTPLPLVNPCVWLPWS